MRLICISDTHRKEYQVSLPDGDILIHCGDFDVYSLEHMERLNKWFGQLKTQYEYIITTFGNHDSYPAFNTSLQIQNLLPNVEVLINETIEIDGITFHGSPNTPPFGNWFFMQTEKELDKTFSLIPEDTNVLITHGPAYGINDGPCPNAIHVGSKSLLKHIKRVQPKIHLHGHIHEAKRITKSPYTTHYNCSLLNDNYQFVYQPIIIDLCV